MSYHSRSGPTAHPPLPLLGLTWCYLTAPIHLPLDSREQYHRPHSQTCTCVFTQRDPLHDRKSSITHACHTHGLANRPLQAAHLLSGLGRGPLFTRTHTLVKLIKFTVIHGRFHDVFLQVRISSSSLPSYMFSIAAFSNIPHQCTAHLGAL